MHQMRASTTVNVFIDASVIPKGLMLVEGPFFYVQIFHLPLMRDEKMTHANIAPPRNKASYIMLALIEKTSCGFKILIC